MDEVEPEHRTGDELLDAVIDYGAATTKAAVAGALGDLKAAKSAAANSNRLLAQIIMLRDKERAGGTQESGRSTECGQSSARQ